MEPYRQRPFHSRRLHLHRIGRTRRARLLIAALPTSQTPSRGGRARRREVGVVAPVFACPVPHSRTRDRGRSTARNRQRDTPVPVRGWSTIRQPDAQRVQ
ncbi:hypothetical protein [Lysobacter gummosus]|uniref:hypothetical protein n=1 Tax=Lysobacter gummosus TaxID=262324 RepID=UPI0036413CEE